MYHRTHLCSLVVLYPMKTCRVMSSTLDSARGNMMTSRLGSGDVTVTQMRRYCRDTHSILCGRHRILHDATRNRMRLTYRW